MKKSKVISLVLLFSLLVLTLMVYSPLSAAVEMEDYKKVILETAQSLKLNGRLNVSESEGMSDVTYSHALVKDKSSVVIQCVVYDTEEVRDFFVAIATAFTEAAKEIYSSVPTTKTKTHTIQGVKVVEQDTPAYLYESMLYSIEMPRVRSMSVERSPLAYCSVTTCGGANPKPYMVVLLDHLQNAGLMGGEVVEGVAFTIKVQAPGYLPWSDTLATKDYEPSSITLEGVVKDEAGNPVSGATISIPDLGKSVTSGIQGNYKLYAQTEGTKPFTKVHNIILQKEVTGASIKVETEKVIPVPGEVTITITALDQDGKPFKGSVDITVVDKNNKQIYFTELKETAGYELDDNGKYSTKLEIWNPGERELKLSGGYTYLRDIPLTATIRVEIQDKDRNTIGKEEKTVPFNLALIHGVVVDNKDLKPVTQHDEPDVLGIPKSMVFDKEKNPNGDFWVMVKPIRRNGKSIRDMMNSGRDVTLNWDKFNPLPLIYSIERAPKAGEILELGKVGKTPLEKIKAWYNEFGRSPHTWPDGTRESKPLVGKYDNGNVNNFMGQSGHCPECLQYGCSALQYKTLSFLNNLKKKKAADENVKFQSKLKGWDYMPVYTIELPLYPQHNAVVLWDRAAPSWKEDGIILDPHAPQAPDWYSVKAVFGNTILLSWKPQPTAPHQESYGAIYPRVRGAKDEKYNLKYFDDNIRPPWPSALKQAMKQLIEGPLIVVECPVDILIVNSQGQRLGILPNGDTIAEFEPIDLYFWVDEKGDKQWFFALPQDTYEIELIGTGSGNFHLLTSPSGEEIHDYGDNPIAAGEQATLTMNPEGDELTLADGKEVTPTIIKLPPAPIPPPKFNKCIGDEPYLYVEDMIMEKGKTLEIPIMMCNAEDLANMDLNWSYNTSVLKIINVTKGSLNEKALFDWNEVSAGKLKIAFASSKGVTGSGSIAVMKFEVIGNTGDTSTLTGTVTTASKTDGTEISVSVTPGEFTVGTPAGHKLVAYYPFNGDTQDHSGNGNHGTNHGATFVSGISGNALKFDGKDDYISTDYTQNSVTAYTIEVWVKTTDSGNKKTFVQDRGSGAGKSLTLGMGQSGGGFGSSGQVFYILDSEGIDTGVHSVQTINDNNWHHVVGVWSASPETEMDPSQFKIYIDGVQVTTTSGNYDSSSHPKSPLTGLGGTKIARHDAWYTNFNGIIDEVKIYKYALTASEIKANYNKIKVSTSLPTGVPLLDDFNDNTINHTLWVVRVPGSGPTVAETNQRVEITIPADSSGEHFGAGYGGICKLRGDFDIQVDYELLVWPSANGVRVGLSAGGEHVERVSFGMNDASEKPREVYLTHFDDGVHGITATSDLSGKLRLVRKGSILTGYYFDSGSSNWIAIHSETITTADTSFSIQAMSNDSYFADQKVKIAFDNLVVNQGEVICPSPKQQLKISDLRGTLNTDNDCNLYVADYGNNQVKMINPNGSVTTYASGIDRPRYQVFDPAGNLYVGSFDGNIYNVSASGGKTIVASGIWSPQGMGFDGAGNLYVAGGYDGKIHRIAPDGSKTTMDSGFAYPKHLAVYSNGNIYVVENQGTLIVRITPEGGKTSLVDLGETILGMATDGEYLYVSHADKISRIDTSGQVTHIAIDLNQPSSLTVCNGSVFVTVSDGIVKLKISPVSGALKISDLQPGPEDGKDVHVYSYTYRNWDNANWGAYPVLVVSYKGIHSGVDCIDRTYIEFDLSSLPSDREIANATLSLYCYNQEGESAEYAVYRVTEPWAEGEGAYHSGEVEPTAPEPWITWNRQPSFDSTQAYATEFIAQGSAPRWINLDVTELVENWYDGSLPNYGIVLRLVEENGSVKVLYFHSSESEEAELRPKLVVTFSGGEQPVPTPPPTWCDYFDSATLDTQWSWVREDPTHWSLTDHPGYLRITIQNGDLYGGWNHNENTLLRPAPAGDFEVVTGVTINPTLNYQQAGLVVYQDDDNHFRLTRLYCNGGKVEFLKEVGASVTSNKVDCDLTTTYLTISKQGSTYTGYWSADGSNWNQVYQYTDVHLSNLKVGLAAFHAAGNTEIPADFGFICVVP